MDILSLISIGGNVALTLLFLWQRNKQGVDTLNKDIINTYKTRIDQLNTDHQGNAKNIKELTQELYKMQGAINEKDKEINRLREIVENRNPELLQVLQEIKSYLVDIKKKKKGK